MKGITWGFKEKNLCNCYNYPWFYVYGNVFAPLVLEISTAQINAKYQFINFLSYGQGKCASGPFV